MHLGRGESGGGGDHTIIFQNVIYLLAVTCPYLIDMSIEGHSLSDGNILYITHHLK